ncbi:NAD-dependent epimerase/dehydratase family protein [Acuticoccus sediminis]|uniref:NAD-dependent epimerase/dehydratase family protein n=1 Tax=Acuticoccus sediminis TaxID=2184697 RepID=UPI001CFCF857|nr:NAD(P)-dependent oxidoreductase [Acuticoccus sediminis]
MTVLVTGATGLVGSRLLPRLVAAGVPCRAIVRAGKALPPGVTAVESDLLDPASLAEAVTGASAIVHLAAVFRTPDTDLIWTVNLEGTRNLIAAASAHAPEARFIMASTSHVYGTDGTHPGREDDAANPAHAYPASKLAAEALLRASGLTWSILRFSFVYGEGDGHLQALPGHVKHGGWHPATRMSLVHHRDIAAAVELALSGTMDGEIVNIADDAPTSVYELAGLVGETLEGVADPLPNPWHLHVDNTFARRLGFQPSVRTVHQAMHDQLI